MFFPIAPSFKQVDLDSQDVLCRKDRVGPMPVISDYGFAPPVPGGTATHSRKEKRYVEGETRKELLCVRTSEYDPDEFYGLHTMFPALL